MAERNHSHTAGESCALVIHNPDPFSIDQSLSTIVRHQSYPPITNHHLCQPNHELLYQPLSTSVDINHYQPLTPINHHY